MSKKVDELYKALGHMDRYVILSKLDAQAILGEAIKSDVVVVKSDRFICVVEERANEMRIFDYVTGIEMGTVYTDNLNFGDLHFVAMAVFGTLWHPDSNIGVQLSQNIEGISERMMIMKNGEIISEELTSALEEIAKEEAKKKMQEKK